MLEIAELPPERGGKIAEGYPVKPPKDGKTIPGAFSWTGTRSLLQRVRKAL